MLKTSISILISLVVFVIARPVFAQFTIGDVILENELSEGNVIVGTYPNSNGYSQIYYEVDGKRTYITNDNHPNADPIINGNEIVWIKQIDGLWQIMIYNTTVKKTTALTTNANNSNPDISNGKVVWEGLDNGTWQIFLYDGTKIHQLTSGDLSINPDIENETVTFVRKDINGTYRSVVHSTQTGETKDVTTGIHAKTTHIEGNKIIYKKSDKQEEFPLQISDIFILNLDNLAVLDVPQTSNIEQIEKELNINSVNEASQSSSLQ